MIRIVAACGSGMGSSMLIKIKIDKIMKELNVDATVEAFSMGSAKSMVNNVDIIICSTYLVDNFDSTRRAKILGVKNLVDDKEIRAVLEPAIKQLMNTSR